jgi:hypothetical protein
MNPIARERMPQILFAVACLAVILVELHTMFVARDDTFAIEGRRTYEVREFASGQPVSHAFLMRGDGLYAIRALLSSDAPVDARLRWTLWRGSVDVPPMTPAAGGEAQLSLTPGQQWATLNAVRDGSSNNRWYTIELQLLQPVATPATEGTVPVPHVSLVASHDNPDRGGVFWIAAARQPGSLVMRAERRGRTLYSRFQAEAEPHLPAILRNEAVQWLVAVAYHWAFVVFAYRVFSDARNAPRTHA